MVWLWIFVLLFHVTNGEDIDVFRVKSIDKRCCITVNETVMFTQNVEKCYTTYQLNRKCVQKTIYRCSVEVTSYCQETCQYYIPNQNCKTVPEHFQKIYQKIICGNEIPITYWVRLDPKCFDFVECCEFCNFCWFAIILILVIIILILLALCLYCTFYKKTKKVGIGCRNENLASVEESFNLEERSHLCQLENYHRSVPIQLSPRPDCRINSNHVMMCH